MDCIFCVDVKNLEYYYLPINCTTIDFSTSSFICQQFNNAKKVLLLLQLFVEKLILSTTP